MAPSSLPRTEAHLGVKQLGWLIHPNPRAGPTMQAAATRGRVKPIFIFIRGTFVSGNVPAVRRCCYFQSVCSRLTQLCLLLSSTEVMLYRWQEHF